MCVSRRDGTADATIGDRRGGSVVWSHRWVVTRHLDTSESPRDTAERSVVDRTRSTRRRRRRDASDVDDDDRGWERAPVRAGERRGRRARRSSIGSIERWREGGARARRRIRFVRSVEGGRREGRKRDDEEGSERREGGVREA